MTWSIGLAFLLIMLSTAVWNELRVFIGDAAFAFIILLLIGLTLLPFFGEHRR